MPVTFKVARVEARPVFKSHEPVDSPEELLNTHVSKAGHDRDYVFDEKAPQIPRVNVLQSTFHGQSFDRVDIRSERNGFVQAVTHAYNRHHHLVFRPDDVWIAILSQLNIYINKHSERLRHLFVAHDGRRKLTILAAGTRHTADFAGLAVQMTELLDRNIVDADLKAWMLPDFSTTTPNDVVVCSVMMMATMKNYFEYEMTMCGLPSVTLEGEKADYQKIHSRLSKLESLFPGSTDPEITAWLALLRPVIQRFVSSFDVCPSSAHSPYPTATKSTIDFWNRVSHAYSLGSGTQYLSGWITAFCVWDSEGKWQAAPRTKPVKMFDGSLKYHPKLVLDGVQYPSIDSADIPVGFCEVDVRVLDELGEMDSVMVAGHMANLISGKNKDTLSPLPCWFVYAKPGASRQPISTPKTMTEEKGREQKRPDLASYKTKPCARDGRNTIIPSSKESIHPPPKELSKVAMKLWSSFVWNIDIRAQVVATCTGVHSKLWSRCYVEIEVEDNCQDCPLL